MNRKIRSTRLSALLQTGRGKWWASLFLCLFVSLASQAQDASPADQHTAFFGYISYSKVLEAMPDMAVVEKTIGSLRQQFDNEMQIAEQEFNRKYEDFLEGQRQFAPSIYKKRQAELTDLMQKNIAFKAEAQKQLADAREEAMKPLHQKLASAVARVAKERSLAFVLNTDGNALPYVDALIGEDITEAVLAVIK